MSGANGDVEAWLRGFVRREDFVRRYPHYAFVLARLKVVPDRGVRVMAVSAYRGRFYLHVNVEFFLAGPQYLRGVLLHEVHHLVLGHLTDPKFRGVAHPDLMTLAMEMSANESIHEPLPGRPVLWTDYREHGVAAGQSTRQRYELLVAARSAGKCVRGGDPLDDHHPLGVGAGPGSTEDPLAAHAVLVDLLTEVTKTADPAGGRIPGGSASGGLLAGRRPGQLLTELAGSDRPPERPLDWREALRMFAGRLRAPVHTYARPNRRFPHRVGEVPGRTYLPTRDRPGVPSLLVAIDTSASMSAAELLEISRQLLVLREFARLTVAECDVAIGRVYRLEGPLESVGGRGGTDLRPVFAPDFLSQHHPDGVIYFTDGLGPYPPADPGVPTLWILSKRIPFGCPWGEKAWLDDSPLAPPSP